MKQVLFKYIRIKNFLSIGEEEVRVDFKPGIHVITGVNHDKEDSKNGVGKSTIADAIFFNLFGRTIRNISLDSIPNWKTGQQCQVSCSFEVVDNNKSAQYRVERTLTPSKAFLYKDGVDITKTIAKTNDSIIQILGTTPELFEQSIIMSINQTEPFFAKTPALKRKFIEGIFNISIFTDMLALVRDDINNNRKQVAIEKSRYDELTRIIEQHQKQYHDMVERKKTKLAECAATISALQHQRSTILENVQAIDPTIKEVLQSELQALQQEYAIPTAKLVPIAQSIYEQNAELKSKLRERERIVSQPTVCASCKRPFEGNVQEANANALKALDITISDINKTVQELTEQKATESVEIEKLDKQKEVVVKKIAEFDQLVQNRKIIDERVRSIDTQIAQTEKHIAFIESEQDQYSSVIESSKSRHATIQGVLVGLDSHGKVLETSKYIVSEEGVKSYIIKKMLTSLNNRLNSYLKKLDAGCLCIFNEYFDETLYNNRDQQCSYYNFSSGERKRIDIAILLTLLDFRRLQSNIQLNITMYDELLDSSLDSVGIERTLEILKERVDSLNEGVYIISHKPEAIKHVTGEQISLVKKDGVTKRI